MQSRTLIPVLFTATFALALSAPLAPGQGSAAKPACSTDPKATNSCPSAQPAPSQQFPYPGEQTPAPAPPPPTNSTAVSPNNQFPYPGDAPATAPAGNPGKQFPYPGDKTADGSSSSASSSSGSSSSSASDPDDPLDTPSSNPTTGNTVRRKLPKPTHLQSDDEREAEDVKVAEFYFDSGNDLGAYNRLKDAVKLIHDDPEAFYLLGTVASRLHKEPESLDAYTKFLALEPDTRRAKAVRRSLLETQARK